MSGQAHKVDFSEILDIMDEYERTHSQQKRRRLENKVLQETVWSIPQDEYSISREDLRRLRQYVNEDDLEAQRLLRKPFIQDL